MVLQLVQDRRAMHIPSEGMMYVGTPERGQERLDLFVVAVSKAAAVNTPNITSDLLVIVDRPRVGTEFPAVPRQAANRLAQARVQRGEIARQRKHRAS
jgi:hypothetical protein